MSRASRLHPRVAWIVAAIASLSLLPAAGAAAGVVKKAVKKVCADTSLAIPDGPEAGDFVGDLVSTGKICPKKLVCGYGGLPLGAVVLDVDAKVRVVHPSVGDLNVLLVNPIGGMTAVSARSGGGGAGFGAGGAAATPTSRSSTTPHRPRSRRSRPASPPSPAVFAPSSRSVDTTARMERGTGASTSTTSLPATRGSSRRSGSSSGIATSSGSARGS